MAEDEAAIEAAERSSPLKGADFGRSRTGRRLRFFFMADIGLGPVYKKKMYIYFKNHEEENSLFFYAILSFLRRSDRVCPIFSTVMHVQKHLKIRPTKAQIRLKHIVLDSRKTKIISSPYFYFF